MAARSVGRLYDVGLSTVGLRVASYSILSRLAKDGPLLMTELADRLAMHRTTCTREVSPLVRSGLVEMTVGTDRRQRLLRLTADGEQKLQAGRPAWAGIQRAIAEDFGEVDLEDMLCRLRRLLEISERHAEN